MTVACPMGAYVRARAPLRLGFAGGGSDLQPFCDTHGGFVMNATVSLYAYAHLKPNSDGVVRFDAAEQGALFEAEATEVVALDPGTLLHCGVYNRMVRQFNGGRPLAVDVRTTVDVPAGSGMGGSSALVVALVEAFSAYLGLALGEYDIARLAFEIERQDLSIAGGQQDQYAAAFGGFNFMEFSAGGRVIINPLRIRPDILQELEASLVLYFTGSSRRSAQVILAQQDGMRKGGDQALAAFLALKQEAVEMKEALLTGRLDRMADTLTRGWMAKKSTSSSVSTSEIERILELALNNGGLAGKVSGAGGGGFIMILCNPRERFRLIDALNAEPGRLSPVVFTEDGVRSWRALI